MELVRLGPARVHFMFRNAVRASEFPVANPASNGSAAGYHDGRLVTVRWMDWREISRPEERGAPRKICISSDHPPLEVSNGTHSRNGTERTPKRLHLRALTSRILDLEIQIQSSADRQNT